MISFKNQKDYCSKIIIKGILDKIQITGCPE